ncbi:MAG TPA: hypothetical protein VFV01_33045 [Spirillospora sp.]|nr:hypothetical protein [Spirillospora sp.]
MRVFRGAVRRGRYGAGAALVAGVTMAATMGAASPVDAPAAPGTVPSVPAKYYGNAGDIPKCRPGHVCATVAYGGKYRVFDFYRYGTYGLSNWHGRGEVVNEQAGGAAARVYGTSGAETACVAAGTAIAGVDWDRAGKIKLTTARC